MKMKQITILSAYSILFLYGGLILSLFYFFNSNDFWGTLISERTLFSVRLSFYAATLATLISLIFAVPAGYALSRYKFRGKRIVDTVLELPMIVSPAALGAILLIFFNTPVGNTIQQAGLQFVFTVNGIILAQFISILGISTRFAKAAIDEVSPRYEIVARSLGASPFRSFYTITLPLCKKGIIAGTFLTWAKSLGEFGATITIAGSMAGKTETLPIAIFTKLSSANIESTVTLIFILVTIGLGTLYLVRFLLKDRFYA